MSESREGRIFRGGLFSFIDVFTSRRMLLFQRHHPNLYWFAAIPALVGTVIVLVAALVWWNGDLRF